MEEEASRKEREQRRRKILLGQQKAQEEFEKAQRENILLEKLTKQSKQERRIAEQYVPMGIGLQVHFICPPLPRRLLEMKNEKELIRQNRIFLEQQHQERRQKDFDEALQREAILGKQLRTDYQRQAEELKVQYADIVQKKKELRRDKVTVACHEITNQIVDMSVNVGSSSWR